MTGIELHGGEVGKVAGIGEIIQIHHQLRVGSEGLEDEIGADEPSSTGN